MKQLFKQNWIRFPLIWKKKNQLIAALCATYRGVQQHHFSIASRGASASGFDTPLWHPVEQQEKEAPCTQHPNAHQGQPPTAETVALQLLKQRKKGVGGLTTLGGEIKS